MKPNLARLYFTGASLFAVKGALFGYDTLDRLAAKKKADEAKALTTSA